MSTPKLTPSQLRALRHIAQKFIPTSTIARTQAGKLIVPHSVVADLAAMGLIEVRASGWQALATVAGRDALDAIDGRG